MGLLGMKVALGLFPKAERIDRQREALEAEYRDYTAYAGSKDLERFEYLNRYLNSAEIEAKENDPEADRAEIEALKGEFEGLKKLPAMAAYFKTKSREAKFAPLKAWKPEFEDRFEGDALDREKWLTRYYRADLLPCGTYSHAGDRHYISNGENLSVGGSKLSIVTRREAARGVAWHPAAGFVPQEFTCTTGLINTGKSLRRQYGKAEAKVRVPRGRVTHAFRLLGERMLPQIDIFNYTGGKFYLGNFWGDPANPGAMNRDVTALTGAFAGRSCIFSLEWAPKSLTWSVNGVVMKTMHRGVPAEPMYLSFESGVDDDAAVTRPVAFEIDWVRFYSKV